MNFKGNGCITLLVFMLLIPALADLIIVWLEPNTAVHQFRIFEILTLGYIKSIPAYISYLIIAFSVIYLYKLWKNRQIKDDE